MYKNLAIGVIITLIFLAYPTRLWGLSPEFELIAKMGKAIVFMVILFFLLKRIKLHKHLYLFYSIPLNVILRLVPVFCLLILYLFFSKNKILLIASQVNTNLIFLTLLTVFVLAMFEEVVCRGYFYNVLKTEFPVYKSALASSAIFALLHVVNIFVYEDFWSVLNQVIFAMAIGMLLCAVYALSGNILLAGFIHFTINIPGAFSKLGTNAVDEIIQASNPTLSENLLSTLFFCIMAVPVFMLATYYLKIAEKKIEINLIKNTTVLEQKKGPKH